MNKIERRQLLLDYVESKRIVRIDAAAEYVGLDYASVVKIIEASARLVAQSGYVYALGRKRREAILRHRRQVAFLQNTLGNLVVVLHNLEPARAKVRGYPLIVTDPLNPVEISKIAAAFAAMREEGL